jgi:hypothetical protein
MFNNLLLLLLNACCMDSFQIYDIHNQFHETTVHKTHHVSYVYIRRYIHTYTYTRVYEVWAVVSFAAK